MQATTDGAKQKIENRKENTKRKTCHTIGNGAHWRQLGLIHTAQVESVRP